jgi:hypothetical protein
MDGYVFSKSGDLPQVVGQISFADMGLLEVNFLSEKLGIYNSFILSYLF